ncbi:response regulator [Halobacteriovorax sp. GB3]|uniref:response regulator n=1 Tax=Halobacteriovorax sp. GB3 TaxID=2719615 RepID=UPI00236226FB|nr:response regulator [Halobacteriovorax sp. GB3]MDD0853293.1 response regulator [Halobacteriovorax sp. GB3]
MFKVYRYLTYLIMAFVLVKLGMTIQLGHEKVPLIWPLAGFAVAICANREKITLFLIWLGTYLALLSHYLPMNVEAFSLTSLLGTSLCYIISPLIFVVFYRNYRVKVPLFSKTREFINFFFMSIFSSLVMSCFFTIFMVQSNIIEVINAPLCFMGMWLTEFFSVFVFAPIFHYIISNRTEFFPSLPRWVDFILSLLVFFFLFLFSSYSLVFNINEDVIFLLGIEAVSLIFCFFALYFFFSVYKGGEQDIYDNRYLSLSLTVGLSLYSFIMSFYLFSLKTTQRLDQDQFILFSFILLLFSLSISIVLGTLFFLLENYKRNHVIIKNKYDKKEEFIFSKNLFLSNIGLEMRTPMNGIIGTLEILGDTNLDVVQKNLIKTVRDSSNSLLDVINDVMDFSKIEESELKLKERSFAVHDLLSSLVDYFNLSSHGKDVSFVVRQMEKLPASIRTDEDRLRQVLKKLISHAYHYVDHGDIVLTVKVLEESLDGRFYVLEFEIRDAGRGIPKNQLKNLFNPLRSHDYNTHSTIGLGLSVCRKIIQLMGGDISVDSQMGKGTTVKFTIDVPKGDDDGKSMKSMENSDFAKAFPSNILVVEDNHINRNVVVQFLKKLGYAPDEACNGKEAIEAFRYKSYDFVFMDLIMPMMNGIDATRVIMDHYGQGRPPIVVALTGQEDEKVRLDCLNSGMSEFLTKPVDRLSLMRVIEKYLIIRESR